MISVEDFANYVGEDYESSDRQADLNRSLSVASAVIGRYVAGMIKPVDEEVVDECILAYALAIYQRSSNNNGQYDSESPAGPLDPMTRVRPLLYPYMLGV